MHKKIFLILFSYFSILFFSLHAQAATLHVTNLNDSGAGSLRNTIAAASPGDTITFDVTGTISLSSELLVTTAITISGPGTSNLEISGSDLSRVFNFNLIGTAQVSGIIISHGNTSDNGGCVNNDGTLILDSVIIENCTTTGSGQGGGVFSNSDTTITNSTIQNNSSVYGGGINVNSGSFSATNVTIANNTGTISSGGFALGSGTATLNNVTISGNTAGTDGGGITPVGGTLSIHNSIIAGNSIAGDPGSDTSDCEGTIHLLDYSLLENLSSSCTVTSGGNNVTGESPDLGLLQDNGGPVTTMALPFDSVAVDAGDNSTCAATDARGVTRPQETNCDMGAFEFSPSTLALSASTYSVSEDGSTVTITVNRASEFGYYDGSVSVDYATSNGTAIAGTNYTSTSGTLTWDENDATPQVVNVPILNTHSTSNSTFTFALSSTTGASSLGSPDSAVVTITGSGALVADLSLTVTCPSDEVEAGDEVTCTVTISNSGNADSENTELELEFTNLEYDSSEIVSASPSSSLHATSSISCTGSNPVTCGLGTLAANQSTSLNVLATVIAEGSFSMNVSVSGNDGAATASGSGSGTTSGRTISGGCSLGSSANENLSYTGVWILIVLSSISIFSYRQSKKRVSSASNIFFF